MINDEYYKSIYDVLKNQGFCGHNMGDNIFKENGTCAWKNGTYEARDNDPECTFEFCPFISKLMLIKEK